MTQLEVFLLVLGSVYQAAAGGFFIMAHEYDGWEIAHFAMPDNTGPNVDIDNNDRLRLVSCWGVVRVFSGRSSGLVVFAASRRLQHNNVLRLSQRCTETCT
jgi:hypothetical protein